MADKNFSVGIDIGTHHTKVVVVNYPEKNKGGGISKPKQSRIIGTGYAPSQGLRYGYVVDPKAVTRSIKKAVKAAEQSAGRGIVIKNASVAISSVSVEGIRTIGTTNISRSDGVVSHRDVINSLEASEHAISDAHTTNRQILHTIPLSYRLDGQDVLGQPEGMRGSKLITHTLFVTCLTQHLHNIVEAVEEAGVTVDKVLAGPLAEGEVLLTQAQKIAGCVLTNVGAETVAITVYDNERPVSLEIFPIGSVDITNDLALGLKLPLNEAEQVKLGGITGSRISKTRLKEIIDARLIDIFELIKEHLNQINLGELLPAGVILTGGGSGTNHIEEQAREVLDLPAATMKPQFSKNNSSGTKSGRKGKTRNLPDTSWTTAYACATLDLFGHIDSDFAEIGDTYESSWHARLLKWVKRFLP